MMRNETITLRPLEPTDLDILYKWENDSAQWVVSDTVAPYSRRVLWEYLKNDTNDIYATRALRLMIVSTEGGEPLGTVDFFSFDPLNNRAELGLLVSREHRGKGIGRMALELICDYARNHLGLKQLYIYVDVGNEVTLKLFGDYGWEQSGLLKSWVKRGNTYHDVVVLQYFL